jgi:hypothetical protein
MINTIKINTSIIVDAKIDEVAKTPYSSVFRVINA